MMNPDYSVELYLQAWRYVSKSFCRFFTPSVPTFILTKEQADNEGGQCRLKKEILILT